MELLDGESENLRWALKIMSKDMLLFSLLSRVAYKVDRISLGT